MESISNQEQQIEQLGRRFWLLGRAEIKELRKILTSSEVIYQCIHGYYQGGSGVLVVTNKRVLLIDKRPFYLNLEEISYESIKNVTFSTQFLKATINIRSKVSKLTFSSISDARLKEIKKFIDQKISSTQDVTKIRLSNTEFLLDSLLNTSISVQSNKFFGKRRYPTKFYSNNVTTTTAT